MSGGDRFVLAVSGGVDSMVLLHASAQALAASSRAREHVTVATFNHATGAHATAAVKHVRRWARAWDLPVVSARAPASLARGGEAAWRDARWQFLRRVAQERDASVVTAHTRDDHLETIVMRAMRGAGARGLSALLAPSAVSRPLLDVSRADVAEYARVHGVPWLDDPSNSSRAHFRNRVRLDLLPALRRASPTLEHDLLTLACRAAALRRACAELARPLLVDAGRGYVIAHGVTDAEWSPDARALLWQTLAEFGGIALDRRGTERLARFSAHGRGGTRIPLSGGYEAVHRHDVIEIRRRRGPIEGRMALAVSAETTYGRWRFRPRPVTSLSSGQPRERGIARDEDGREAPDVSTRERGDDAGDAWSAWLPSDATLEVRAWRAGDRMPSSGLPRRRVKRFLADARIAAADREGWPVVVADGEIVWIPGVRRGRAATVRSGRPRVCIVCERLRH